MRPTPDVVLSVGVCTVEIDQRRLGRVGGNRGYVWCGCWCGWDCIRRLVWDSPSTENDIDGGIGGPEGRVGRYVLQPFVALCT